MKYYMGCVHFIILNHISELCNSYQRYTSKHSFSYFIKCHLNIIKSKMNSQHVVTVYIPWHAYAVRQLLFNVYLHWTFIQMKHLLHLKPLKLFDLMLHRYGRDEPPVHSLCFMTFQFPFYFCDSEFDVRFWLFSRLSYLVSL